MAVVTPKPVPSEEQAPSPLLDRPLPGFLALNLEQALYLALVLLATLLRFWDLGARALHHDESMHAFYSWNLYRGGGYTHDPMMHGTFVFIANAFMYFLVGVSDASARFVPALLGTALVALPYFLRPWLGRAGALAAAALLTLSPSFLYFSRFIREDIHTAFFTLVMVVSMFRYWEGRRPLYLYIFSGALAFSFATKEVTYIHGAVFGLFLVGVAWREAMRFLGGATHLSPPADLLLVLGTLALPQLAGLGLLAKKLVGLPAPDAAQVGTLSGRLGVAGDPFLIILFLLLLLVSAVVGMRWNAKVWLGCAGVFYLVFTLLYTTFLSNPGGVFTGSISGLAYWVAQQGVKRGGQPWFYYLLLLPLYEFVPVLFGLAGVAYFAVRRQLFTTFLIYWCGAALFLYGWAGEKMPWLGLHLALPFILLAGAFIGRLIGGVDWRRLTAQGAGWLALCLMLAALVLLGLSRAGPPGGPAVTPLAAQRQWLQFLLLLVLCVALLGVAARYSRRLGAAASLRTVGLTLLGLLMLFSVHTAWQVTYKNGDVAVEMLVYTQTTPDVLQVMKDIERVAFRTGAEKNLKVAYDSESSWPFEWYLRDYRGRAFYGGGVPPADAPVVLVGVDNQHEARVRPALAGKYLGQRYRLRWWFPEEYRNLTGPTVLATPFDPALRSKLWNYLLYRETSPLGSTDFYFYVRQDLVGGAWMPAATAAQALEGDVYADKYRRLAAALVWGLRGAGDGQFNEPKGLAVGPDGNIYVVEARNHRVQKFDPWGRFLGRWGGPGSGPGQFNEPWGIAVDRQSMVYVADTWNHRIQKFDAQGRFIQQWGFLADTRGEPTGSPGGFYGPRGLATDAAGNLYVTDTGNKRVQKFDGEGRFLAQFGGSGAGEGQLSEPVGIAVDQAGHIYVADTWNRRIQKFDAQFRPLAQWPVRGWEGESVLNKPFLAVDGEGGVYATDPENHRIIKFTPTGAPVAVWGRFGTELDAFNLPTGLAVDMAGNLLVTDSGNHRILRFPPVR